MNIKLLTAVSLSLFLVACEGGDKTAGGETAGGETAGGETAGGETAGGETAGGETAGGETAGGETAGGETAGGETAGGQTTGGETTGGEGENPSGPVAYKCPSTIESDAAYVDTFVANRMADRNWGADKSNATAEGQTFRNQSFQYTVSDIAGQFNTARALDPTIKEELKMPNQSDWDAMSANDKSLYLVNSERCARGITPLEGSISNMIDSANLYAQDLSTNRVLTHGSNPVEDIKARMTAAGVNRGENADFIAQNESLATVGAGTSPGFTRPSLYEIEVRAVYNWIYDDINDGGSGYGHRTHVLRNKYEENSGTSNVAEGLFGMATIENDFDDASGNLFREGWTVMHSFDPNATFDMSAVAAAPAIQGPESAADCEAGSTYIESTDADGNNTSTCQ